MGLRDVHLFRSAAIMKARTKSCLSCPMTSKTTIGEREKGRECHNQLDNFAAGRRCDPEGPATLIPAVRRAAKRSLLCPDLDLRTGPNWPLSKRKR